MTLETLSPSAVVAVVIFGAIVVLVSLAGYWWAQYKKFWANRPDGEQPSNSGHMGSGPVDPKFAARFYEAYVAEVVRLAGFNPQTFLQGQDLKNGGVMLDLIVTAEGLLLHSIVEQLRRPRPSEVPPERHMPMKDVFRNYSPTPHAAARELAGDERLWEHALTLLKKINPVLQQVAGAWVGPKPG